MNNGQEKILQAAIKIDKKTYTLRKPNRHHNIIKRLVEMEGFKPPVKGEQGFLTSNGRFVDRVEAAEIAIRAGQLKSGALIAPPNLYSEDLW